MPNYFDYIEESARTSVENIDDADCGTEVYNEMDATMCDFNSYVQEGVGVAIAASVGGAALIGGLIALIAKCFGSSSPSSAARAAKEAEKAIDQSEEFPEDGVEVLTEEEITQTKKEVRDKVKDYLEAFEALRAGKPIPTDNLYSKKVDNSVNYPQRGSKDYTSGISVNIPKDITAKNNKNGVDSLMSSQKEGRKNRSNKRGIKVATTKDEAKSSLKQVQEASKEIDQMRKDLQTAAKQCQQAEQAGKLKLTDSQKKQLNQMHAKAGHAVSNGSQKLKAPSTGIINTLGAAGKKAIGAAGKLFKK